MSRESREEFRKLRRLFGTKSVDELLELLSSEDLKTRFVAEMALRDVTGT